MHAVIYAMIKHFELDDINDAIECDGFHNAIAGLDLKCACTHNIHVMIWHYAVHVRTQCDRARFDIRPCNMFVMLLLSYVYNVSCCSHDICVYRSDIALMYPLILDRTLCRVL